MTCWAFVGRTRLPGAGRVRRHAEHEHAGALRAFLDLLRNAVAGLDLPFVEPDAERASRTGGIVAGNP